MRPQILLDVGTHRRASHQPAGMDFLKGDIQRPVLASTSSHVTGHILYQHVRVTSKPWIFPKRCILWPGNGLLRNGKLIGKLPEGRAGGDRSRQGAGE